MEGCEEAEGERGEEGPEEAVGGEGEADGWAGSEGGGYFACLNGFRQSVTKRGRKTERNVRRVMPRKELSPVVMRTRGMNRRSASLLGTWRRWGSSGMIELVEKKYRKIM